MRIILLCVIVQVALARTNFGTSYLGNSKLCKSWSCINSKLGFEDALPHKEHFVEVLRELLPESSWLEVVDSVAEVCYNETPRRYTNTCPGQALLYCALDNLIEKCPEEFVNKNDACAPPSSLAGFKFMFSQSRYEDFAKNLPYERRPAWFLKNYFNSKCCNLPQLFNSSMMTECGFNSLIHYNVHQSQRAVESVVSVENYKNFLVRNTTKKPERTQIPEIQSAERAAIEKKLPEIDVIKITDPLDCCDLSEFIPRSTRYVCNFKTSWKGSDRLSIDDELVTTTPAMEVTTEISDGNDVKILPVSCESSMCIFRKLQITDDQGFVNIDAYSKLLDNMTEIHPEWKKAKARVVTKCLSRRITEYEADCEINKILACTFDLLTENCPFAKPKDPCRHSYDLDNTTMCQISSSKFRPKYRRQFCGIPSLVSHKLLGQCDLTGLFDITYVPNTPAYNKNKHNWHIYRNSCKDLTKSTKCVLNSIGVINKYGFLDYFKMKHRIQSYTTKNSSWSPFTDIHLNAFMNYPMYNSYCNSPKKLLNVIDTMMMTCPISKRRDNEFCRNVFNGIATIPPKQEKNKFKKVSESKDVHQMYYPAVYRAINTSTDLNVSRGQDVKVEITHPKRLYEKKVLTTPEYNFWVLNSNNVPPIKTMTIKPQRLDDTKPRRVLTPVYTRYPYANDKMNENNSTFKYSNEVSNSPGYEYQDAEVNNTAKPAVSMEEALRGPAGVFEYPQLP